MNSKTIIGGNGTGITGAGSEGASEGAATALWLSVLLTLGCAGLRCQAAGPTNAVHAAAPANRYLFVVEISRSMQPRGDGALGAVQDLLNSGMSGQLQTGDTLGLWTFNKELFRGDFPLQTWSPAQQRGITGRVMNFLRGQRCEEKARLDRVMPSVQEVVKRSRFITVVIISSGEQGLRGTPFDDPINKVYTTWRKQQEKANMPFITLLQAQNGTITDYRVGQAPWTADLPPLPKELQVARANAKAAAVAAKAAATTVPPLIVSGRKPTTTPSPVLAAPATPTNASAETGHVVSSPGPESAAAVVPAPRLAAASATTPTPATTPGTIPETTAPHTVPPPSGSAGNDAQRTLARQSLPGTPSEIQPSAPPANTRPSAEPEKASPSRTPTLAVKMTESAAAPALPTKGPEPAQAAKVPVTMAEAARTPAPPAAVEHPAGFASSPPVAATSAPAPASFGNKLLWAIVAGGVGLAAWLVWYWRSRGRSEAPASLITHSLEQHKH